MKVTSLLSTAPVATKPYFKYTHVLSDGEWEQEEDEFDSDDNEVEGIVRISDEIYAINYGFSTSEAYKIVKGVTTNMF